MQTSSTAVGLGLALGGAVWLAAPVEVHACGGTFCDTGPMAMPVDQTGENILFVLDGNTVEAHIQIQYDPDTEAEKFAWVIPVQTLPQFSVGSEQLFQNLLAGSVPVYGFDATSDDACTDWDANGSALTSAGSTGGDEGGDGDGDGDGDGPQVVFSDTVGAYDITVLDGGTAESVMEWLANNGYEQDMAAMPILEDYLEEENLFVALKLTNGADVDEIQPIVLNYQGDEPCVPLRLTRIAAQDDMEVRTFFLGDARTVPTNYRHVLVNPLMIDWDSLGSNYADVIVQAVDANVAEGRAFVTEYAGNSDVVSQAELANPDWDSTVFAEMQDTPTAVVDELELQDLIWCDVDWTDTTVCEYREELLVPILHEFLPVPDGVDEFEFYDCLPCFEGSIDMMAWDAPLFADRLEERIFEPGRHARQLLQDWGYLTRMYTLISPHEMTEDPIFHTNPDLPTVPNEHIASVVRKCDEPGVVKAHLWTLPDGREIWVPTDNWNDAVWHPFEDESEMPWEEDIEEGTMAGANQVLVDNTDLINSLLDAYNESVGYASTNGVGETGGDAGATDEDGTGCGCTSARGVGPLGAGSVVLGIGLLGWRRRRRQALA